jgi:hypothetical protein
MTATSPESRVATIYYLKCPVFNNNEKWVVLRNGKAWPIHKGKNSKEIFRARVQVWTLAKSSEKHKKYLIYNSILLYKELKEVMIEEVKKGMTTMSLRRDNIKKQVQIVIRTNRNSVVEEYTNWSSWLTTGFNGLHSIPQNSCLPRI